MTEYRTKRFGERPAGPWQGKPIYPEDPRAYLAIATSGRVSVFSSKIEMGQGVETSLAQMLAEELGVDLASIDMISGDTDLAPWDMGTFGSMSTRMFGQALRAAGAKARQMLIGLASQRLNAPADGLAIEHGVVFVMDRPDRRIGIGVLSDEFQAASETGDRPALHRAAEFSLIGRSPPRRDAQAKVTGAALYAADIRLDGMLYARLLRPPAQGAVLIAADTSRAERQPGVRVVRQGDLIAVLHEQRDAADAALALISADWRRPPTSRLNREIIFNHIHAHAGPPVTLIEQASPPSAAQDRMFQTRFEKGYVAHGPVETHAALAGFDDGRLTIWASTQTPFPTRDAIALALGLDPAAVRVIAPLVGGGFGGKSANAQAVEAARLAMICDRPVQVERTRAEEFLYDTFDPASLVEVRSSLASDGRVSNWDYIVYAAGERGAVPFYDFPGLRVRSAGATGYGGAAPAGLHPFAVGPWRGPGANMNVFAIESQMDIMAAAAGTDPVAFRLRHLSNPRMQAVLSAAAEAFGWRAGAGPTGRGLGVACSSDAGSCVATMAEVEVNKSTGQVKVRRLVCAQDMGMVVNPLGARMQIEGGLTMGLGYTLSEELRFQGGDILDRNFADYPLPRFSDAPPIEAVLVRNDALAPQGCGEPACTTAGAVIANAVFDATGSRPRRLPMTPARVLDEMLHPSSGG
jgi:isoquinoline 1-oxidoreductase